MTNVKNKRYEMVSNDGKKAVIHFRDSNETKTYKVIDLETIKTKIQNGKELNFDGCYIKDFSYKELSGDGNKSLVKFSAEDSFWDGIVDFSQAQFVGGDVDFSGAQFGDGRVSFFIAQFEDGDVDFRDTCFGDGGVDFSGVQFGNGDVDFCNAEFGDGNVFFRNIEFDSGNVDFSGVKSGKGDVDFCGAQFGNGDVDFCGVRFGDGDVKFRSVRFGDGNVDFSDAKFGNGTVDFHLARFWGGNVFFSDANFGNGNVDFLYTQFGDGDVDFCGTKFGSGNVDFGYAEFGNGSIYFRGAEFGNGDVDFTRTQFGDGECYFDDITAKETSFFFRNLIIHSHITFCSSVLGKLVFENCTSHNVIEFQEASDEQTGVLLHNAISELAFLNFCNLGTIRLNWNAFNKALTDYKGDLGAIAEEFQMLKENYHNQGQYDWEDKAYVEFKKRYTEELKVPSFKEGYRKSVGAWLRKKLLKLLSVVGKFGTDYSSIALTMFVVVFVWGILYALPLASIYPAGAAHHWWSPIYYSVITFFTVGYGDLSAQNGFTAFLCGVESFLGVFLMSYFSVAVVRKILR